MLSSEYRQRLIKKHSLNGEDMLLAAKIIDKFEAVQKSNIPQSTKFLNERDIAAVARPLLEELSQRYALCGGYVGAERACLLLLPDWMEEEAAVQGSFSPVAVIRAVFSRDLSANTQLGHRDFLGAVMGLGIEREMVGDIIPREESCDIVVAKEILAYVLTNLEQAGRTRLRLEVVSEAEAGVQEFKLVKDTVASLRLDAVTAAGFSLSREKTLQAVNSGRVSLNNIECQKPDRPVTEGDKISLRGYGRIELAAVKGQSRKNRIIIEIKRYI